MAPKNRGKICMQIDATDMLIDLWSEETIEFGLENGKSQRKLEKYTTRYAFSSCQVPLARKVTHATKLLLVVDLA